MKYFIDQDDDGHWYVVPEPLEEKWQQWKELPDNKPDAWSPPVGVTRIGGWPGLVRFENPVM